MDRVFDLLTSPITALCVAVLIGGLAMTGRFSVPAALGMFGLAWIIAVVGVYRSSPLQSLPWMLRMLWTAFIGSALGIGVFHLGQWVGAKPLTTTAPAKAVVAPFSVSVRFAFVSDAPGPLSMFMAGYQSMYGETASPVVYLAFFQIVNAQDIPNTIDRFSVAVSDHPDGPWQSLVPISLRSARLFSLGVESNGGAGGVIALPRGISRLGTPMTPKDLGQAAPLNPIPILEGMLEKPIRPHETASGWAAFDLSDRSRGFPRWHWRITLHDTAQASFTAVVASPKPNALETDAQPALLQVAGPPVDLRSAHIRYYSDPFPNRPPKKR